MSRSTGMVGRYDQAEVLAALWKLGAGDEMMPTSHGILDRALEALQQNLPTELGELTFSTTGVGRRSYELPDILLAAQEAMLTSEPNPTYLSTLVTISPEEAKEIAVMHGLGIRKATELGKQLLEQVAALKCDAEQTAMAA
jgi:hypothetical protein